jgi:CRP-like cAMP-binding protein
MSNLLDEVEVLRRIPLFCGIEPAKLKLIAFSSERLTFEEGQELFHQGDPGDAAYVIVSGTADVLVTNRGETSRVASFARNDIIGEIAILCDVPRTATVMATSTLETLKIRKESFLRFIADFPSVGIEMMRVLADRLSRTTAELSAARARAAGA